MNSIGRVVVGVVALAGLAMGAGQGADRASAQEISVGGGASTYDLSGTGTSWVAGVRYGHTLTPWARLEVGSSVFRYESQADTKHTFLFPEVGVAFPFRAGAVSPYVAAGAGGAFVIEGAGETEATLFGALGVTVPLGDGWSLRPELRVRVVDPWVGTLADYTVSFARSLR